MDKIDSLLQNSGRIHSIETMGLLDGPGVRTIFFLQGCPLRCKYCHNPDSQGLTDGNIKTVEEIVKIANRYKSYYGTDGGVTFSGGEPLLQGEFLYSCIYVLKKQGFNICLDTSAFGDKKYYKKILPLVDTILLDIKAFTNEKYMSLVRGNMKVLKEFMNDLPSYNFHGQIWIRHVMIPSYTDNIECMHQLIDVIKPISNYVERIEILPYHIMGKEKYESMGIPYPLEGIEPMDKNKAFEYQIYANRLFANYVHEKFMERKKQELALQTADNINTNLNEYENSYYKNKLRIIKLFRDMDDDTFNTVFDKIKLIRLEKGEFVFHACDPANYMYIICDGHIKIYDNTIDGHEQIYYIYNYGDFIGGLNILKNIEYQYFGQALDTCIIAAVPKEICDEYLLKNVQVLHSILEKSFDRIRHAENLIQRLSTSNASMKVAALLIRLGNNFGLQTDNGILIDLSINREEMGNYSGLTRETMTRKLGEFKELGFIEVIGSKVLIKDLEALRDYSF